MTALRTASLEVEGWVRRSLLAEPRLSEVAEAYRVAGFEILTVDPDPGEMPDGCGDCEVLRGAKIVYTRKPALL